MGPPGSCTQPHRHDDGSIAHGASLCPPGMLQWAHGCGGGSGGPWCPTQHSHTHSTNTPHECDKGVLLRPCFFIPAGPGLALACSLWCITNCCYSYGDNPACIGCQADRADVVEQLLQRKADAEVEAEQGVRHGGIRHCMGPPMVYHEFDPLPPPISISP